MRYRLGLGLGLSLGLGLNLDLGCVPNLNRTGPRTVMVSPYDVYATRGQPWIPRRIRGCLKRS